MHPLTNLKTLLAYKFAIYLRNNALHQLVISVQVFIACGIGKSGNKAVDPFRKPEAGMWRIMEQHFNSGIPVDMDQLFPLLAFFYSFKPSPFEDMCNLFLIMSISWNFTQSITFNKSLVQNHVILRKMCCLTWACVL